MVYYNINNFISNTLGNKNNHSEWLCYYSYSIGKIIDNRSKYA